jgi:hypothetical protein
MVAKSIEHNVMLDETKPTEIDCMDGYGLNANDYTSCTSLIFYGDNDTIVSVDIVGSGKFSGLVAGATSSTSHVIETASTQSLSTVLLATVGTKDVDVNKYAGNGLYAWGDKYIYRGGITKTNTNGLATSDYGTDVDSGSEVSNYIQVPWEDYSTYTDCTTTSNKCYRIVSINEDGSITIARDKSVSSQVFDNTRNTYYSASVNTQGYNDLLSNDYTAYSSEYREYSDMYTYLYGSEGYENTTIKPYSSILQPLDVCLNKVNNYAGVNNTLYSTTSYVKDTCDVSGKSNTTAVSSLQNKYVRFPYIEEYLNATLESTCTQDYQFQCRNQNYLYNKTYFWSLNGKTSESWLVRHVFSSGFVSSDGTNASDGVRPVVNLKSTILISEGSGTQADPYVIKW